jgi:serine protease Do
MMLIKPKLRFLIVSLVLCSSLLLSGSCDYIAVPNQPGEEPPRVSENITTTPDPGWIPPEICGDGQELVNFTPVVAMVRPGVVAISTEVVSYDWFNNPVKQEGAGSGWIIDAKEGYIVTNNHVIEGALSIIVTLYDERSVSAEVVGTDRLSDLAVIQIDAANLNALPLGNSAGESVGNWVLAIGNSLGLGISATHGIISALGVSLPVSETETVDNMIQTDTAINPGNSGGPLVNLRGEVIGITSIKTSAVGIEGMGYAIALHTALPIIQDVITQGYVIRPFLGVSMRDADQYLQVRYNLVKNEGAFITYVVPGSPADKAGLKEMDVIEMVDGQYINTAQELITALHESSIGDSIELAYWRGSDRHTVTVTLAESPAP